MSTRSDKADLLEDMLERLTSRGIFPHQHELTMWQCSDGVWVAAIIIRYPYQEEIESTGESLRVALEQLRAKIESHPKFCKLADAIGK